MVLQRSRRQTIPAGSFRVGLATLCLSACAVQAPEPEPAPEPALQELAVSSTADNGPGSLREALQAANAWTGLTRITFDTSDGLFLEPQVITLEAPLPPIRSQVLLDGYIVGRLWKATGVTLDGGGKHRVLKVAPGGTLDLRNITLANGFADQGGGLANHGALNVSGVSFLTNHASGEGGGLWHAGDRLHLVNSTFDGNQAAQRGGALAILGSAIVVHVTVSDNAAPEGAGLFSAAPLQLTNSILANNQGGLDCYARKRPTPRAGHNLIRTSKGCGSPLLEADPRLERLGYFNGPTRTRPVNGSSPAVNLGDPALALDAAGTPLRWDQRGNGDPRMVAGYPDLGAFELQAFPDLVVDTIEDTGLRGCMPSGKADCPLRAALELAAAMQRDVTITFDPRVFTMPVTLQLDIHWPETERLLRVDASNVPPITVQLPRGASPPVVTAAGWELLNVKVSQ